MEELGEGSEALENIMAGSGGRGGAPRRYRPCRSRVRREPRGGALCPVAGRLGRFPFPQSPCAAPRSGKPRRRGPARWSGASARRGAGWGKGRPYYAAHVGLRVAPWVRMCVVAAAISPERASERSSELGPAASLSSSFSPLFAFCDHNAETRKMRCTVVTATTTTATGCG